MQFSSKNNYALSYMPLLCLVSNRCKPIICKKSLVFCYYLLLSKCSKSIRITYKYIYVSDSKYSSVIKISFSIPFNLNIFTFEILI